MKTNIFTQCNDFTINSNKPRPQFSEESEHMQSRRQEQGGFRLHLYLQPLSQERLLLVSVCNSHWGTIFHPRHCTPTTPSSRSYGPLSIFKTSFSARDHNIKETEQQDFRKYLICGRKPHLVWEKLKKKEKGKKKEEYLNTIPEKSQNGHCPVLVIVSKQLPRILAFNTELALNQFSTLKINCSAAETCIYPLPCYLLSCLLNLRFQALSSCLKIIFFMWSYRISFVPRCLGCWSIKSH